MKMGKVDWNYDSLQVSGPCFEKAKWNDDNTLGGHNRLLLLY